MHSVLMALGTMVAAPLAALDGALRLEDVVRSVDVHFPLVRAAILDVAAAEGELLAAEGAFDPVFKGRAAATPFGEYTNHRAEAYLEQPTPIFGTTFFGGYRNGGGTFAPYDGKAETNQLGEMRAGMAIPLGRNGAIDRRRAALERAQLGRRISSLGAQAQRLESVRAASRAYWAWVAAGRKLQVANALLDIAQVRDAQLRRRVEQGDIPAIERTDNARAILQRQASVVAAERALQQAAIQLSLYLRDDTGAPVLPDVKQLPEALPEPAPASAAAVTETIAEAQARRPDVQRVDALRAQQRVDLRYAENQMLPGFDVVVQGAQDFGPGKALRARPELQAMVVVEIPLALRTARGRVRAAEAGLRKTGEQARYARERVAAEVRDAASAMEAARQRLEVIRMELEVARELEEAERTRFFLGESTLLVVNIREQATAEAAAREIDALTDYHRAAADYRAATGQLPDA